MTDHHHCNNKIVYISGSQTATLGQMANDAALASKQVFFAERQVVQFHDYYPCRVLDIKESRRRNQGSMGMIYRKNWPFKDLLNYHLLVMKESGVMDKLHEPYLRATKKTCPNQQTIKSIINKPIPVSTNETFSLYLIVLIGLLSALIFLTTEILCCRHVSKKFR